MRNLRIVLTAIAFAFSATDLAAQDVSNVPRPSIVSQRDSSIVIAMPAFNNPSEVARDDDGWPKKALSKVACNDLSYVQNSVRGHGQSYAAFRAAISGISVPSNCKVRLSGVEARIQELYALPDNESAQNWKTRTGTQLAVNHAPFIRGGNGADVNLLAKQASQPSYQKKIRENVLLTETQAAEFIQQLVSKKGIPMELKEGTLVLYNYGTGGVHGERIRYHRLPNEGPFWVVKFTLSDGTILYVAESCSNPYFPLQATTYWARYNVPAPPVVVEIPQQPVIVTHPEIVPGPGFYCTRGIGQGGVCALVACAAITVIGDVLGYKNICGFPLSKEESTGNKPVGKPITQFDVAALGGANLSLGISPSAEARSKSFNLPSSHTGLANGTSIRSFQANIGAKVGFEKIQNLFARLR
jgi:hypothetical protein